MDGAIISSIQIEKLDRTRIKKILKEFTGSLEQIPPMYSALKQDGQPLYRLARKGVEVDRKTRNINIYGIDVLGWDKDRLTVKIACSSGTYIRVLANDIGKAYGTGAALSGLRRIRIGSLGIERTAGIEFIEGLADSKKDFSSSSWMISLEELLKDSITISVSNKYEEQVKNGSRLSRSMLEQVSPEPGKAKENKGFFDDMAAVRTTGGKLLAVHRLLMGYDKIKTLNMDKVFTKSVVIF
jgi:tRNA pseudouridine55 synthase